MRTSFVSRPGTPVPAACFRPFLRRLASFLDAPAGTLTVLFCDDREIADLNGRWRGKPRATDVLSFPGGGATGAGQVHLGDIVISVETAARQARRARRPLAREIEVLLAHGLLHLLGYDHEADDGTMLRLQKHSLDSARRLVPTPTRAVAIRKVRARPASPARRPAPRPTGRKASRSGSSAARSRGGRR